MMMMIPLWCVAKWQLFPIPLSYLNVGLCVIVQQRLACSEFRYHSLWEWYKCLYYVGPYSTIGTFLNLSTFDSTLKHFSMLSGSTLLTLTFYSVQYVPQCTVCSTVYSMFYSVQYVPQCTVCSTVYNMFHSLQYVLQCTVCSTVYSMFHIITATNAHFVINP